MADSTTQPPPPAKRDGLPGATNSAIAGAGLLFLREDDLRSAQDILFFAIRDLTEVADQILDELGFGRAHHRCLHWIARRPNMKVGELLTILGITKQSLTRVLGPLIDKGYVLQVQGPQDRRQRLLSLTETGAALERKLFDTQRERFTIAFREAGGPGVEGFKRVARGLCGKQGRAYIDAMEESRLGRGKPPAV